ncbi:hypothetical protein Zmor_018689 [Zophobas morio]|uniref:Uncharacterized protein n=1 Tax=Zophobas morio TaxID=2755281 RepID=A0AA38IEV3_9CUCU|nr:hypothetical protein Zmor_018689 [Zophobas morio]
MKKHKLENSRENSQDSLEEKRRKLLEELQLVDQQLAQREVENSTLQRLSTSHISENENTDQLPEKNQKDITPQTEQISLSEENVLSTDSSNFKFYKKRKGVVDFGKGYEYLTCALYALKLGLDDDVSDFHMTTNNEDWGDFDDIEIQATFKNGKRSIFLFQLKHKFNKDCITENLLTNEIIHKNKKQQKSKFYLPHYLQSISNLEKQDEDLHFILYTNSQTAIRDGSVLSFKKKYPTL